MEVSVQLDQFVQRNYLFYRNRVFYLSFTSKPRIHIWKKNFQIFLLLENDVKPFWETCKPCFFSKDIKTSEIIHSLKEGLI